MRKRDKEVGMKLRNPEKTPGRRHESLPNDLELADIEARSSSFASLIKLTHLEAVVNQTMSRLFVEIVFHVIGLLAS